MLRFWGLEREKERVREKNLNVRHDDNSKMGGVFIYPEWGDSCEKKGWWNFRVGVFDLVSCLPACESLNPRDVAVYKYYGWLRRRGGEITDLTLVRFWVHDPEEYNGCLLC